MLIHKLGKVGVKSDHLFIAGLGSIGLTLARWAISMAKPSDSKAQADRWGLFIGEWTPSFFILGVALRQEELAAQTSLDPQI